MTSSPSRLEPLAAQDLDLLVIGGGITGCGVLRDARLRGLTCALVEKEDLASGTSTRSSKLVHGGLRYLEQLELGLVFESVNERKRLMSLARHLVRPLPFLVTRYRGDRRWLITLDLGLWVYDALSFFGSYRLHRTHGRAGTLALEPGLRAEGLSGGVLYYDALTDDGRLTLENALDARALGATVLTHAEVRGLVKDGTGRVVGATVVDRLSGLSAEVRARVVVNATGPWTDGLRAMAGAAPLLGPTKGVHLVVDARRLPLDHAMLLLSPRDRRVVFAIPWGLGRTVVGTTDTFFDGDPDHVEPTPEDIGYLLETANAYFPRARLSVEDVLSTWSGLRPLLAPAEGDRTASQVSREHTLDDRPGFITIAGGKLTTYRPMAQEVVDHVMAQLGRTASSTTHTRPLPGAVGLAGSDEALDELVRSLASRFGVDGAGARYFAELYGVRAAAVLERMEADPAAAARLDPELPMVMAQVDEAVEHELAMTLEDVLVRRVPLILRARDQGAGVARAVAERMARHLGWDASRVDHEVARYHAAVASSQSFRRRRATAPPELARGQA